MDEDMRLRRCAILFTTPKERLDFDLASLAKGGTGVQSTIEWIALAPHLDEQLVLSIEDMTVLGQVSPLSWSEVGELARTHALETLNSLVERGLLLAEDGDANMHRRDERLRAMHWRALDAVAHKFSRWHDVDTLEAQRVFGNETELGFVERLGPCPPPVCAHAPIASPTTLIKPVDSPLDEVLARRFTCRNYDTTRALSASDFGAVLYRAFGARAVHDYAPGVTLLKRSAPSAGGLHAVGAYVLVRQVEGIASGLYHYHPVDHALEPLGDLGEPDAAALALRFLGGQTYFADAHAVVALAGRFHRNFWKYRNHAKAYRSVILDSGHLSQTLYLAATELGLGAFITAGVNELDIEKAFGLDPMEEGVIAACGFGLPAAERIEVEFDPLNVAWPTA
jgi:putative peptide maturation dehydrogenase